MIFVVITAVAWLQGCWQSTAGERLVEEQWTAPRAGIMLSMGRTIRANQLIEYEWVLLREKDGALEYEAHPSAQASAVFTSRTATADEVVFENPTHDFPQRVGYRREGDSLLAWIGGTVAGKPRRVEVPYHRVVCP